MSGWVSGGAGRRRPWRMCWRGASRPRSTRPACGAPWRRPSRSRGRAGRPVEVADGLQERRMGPLSGRRRDEAWAAYAEAKVRWMAGQLDFTHDGGESYAEIRRRVVPAFQALARRHPGETIVVVAHGVVIRVLLTSLLEGHSPADFERIAIDFVAINDLRHDGARWRAEVLGARAVDEESNGWSEGPGAP